MAIELCVAVGGSQRLKADFFLTRGVFVAQGNMSSEKMGQPGCSGDFLKMKSEPSYIRIPGSPTTIFFFLVGFRTTIILVGVYHHPKGTTIFKMVVDFQGIISISHEIRISPLENEQQVSPLKIDGCFR